MGPHRMHAARALQASNRMLGGAEDSYLIEDIASPLPTLGISVILHNDGR